MVLEVIAMKINVGVSNRHVHLTEYVYSKLFPYKEIEKRNDLHQIGEFASTDTVDIEYGGKVIEHVRVLGPFRSDNQVELLGSDLNFLGIVAPVRRSGVLDGTPGIILKNGENRIELDHGVIRAERHVHVPTSMQEALGLHERDKVIIRTDSCEFDANVKVSDNGYLELHIDKDEASEYGLQNGDEVEVIKCGK